MAPPDIGVLPPSSPSLSTSRDNAADSSAAATATPRITSNTTAHESDSPTSTSATAMATAATAHYPAHHSATSSSTSRRTSRVAMNPPPLPLSSPAHPPGSVGVMAAGMSAFPSFNSPDAGLPLRHPQPMTPVELHKELEAEQEAIVNRLTRELTALRAHSASVASSTSSSSALETVDPSLLASTSGLTGLTHPTPSRRHRSSSSVSRGSISNLPLAAVPGAPGTYSASVPSQGHRPGAGREGRDRERERDDGGRSRTSVDGGRRLEDAVAWKGELEEAKRENEVLRQRVRELERMLREKREGHPTTASGSRSPA